MRKIFCFIFLSFAFVNMSFADSPKELHQKGVRFSAVGNYDQAAVFLKLAADQGNIDALVPLGYLYQDGLGVERDDDKAQQLFKEAYEAYQKNAENGDADAQFSLGFMNNRGVGTPQDKSKARKWLEKAAVSYKKKAMRGDTEAQYYLGAMYEFGYGVARNRLRAIEWYEKALESEDLYIRSEAQYALGDMYSLTDSDELKDIAKSRYYYQLACEQDVQLACDKLKGLPEE